MLLQSTSTITFSGEFIFKIFFVRTIGLSCLALLGAPTVPNVSLKIFNCFSSLFFPEHWDVEQNTDSPVNIAAGTCATRVAGTDHPELGLHWEGIPIAARYKGIQLCSRLRYSIEIHYPARKSNRRALVSRLKPGPLDFRRMIRPTTRA